MTLDDIAKARQLIAAASPSPWTFTPPIRSGAVNIYGFEGHAGNDDGRGGDDGPAEVAQWVVEYGPRRDASFITYARDALPAALDHIEQLQAALVKSRSFIGELADEDCSYRDECPSSARHYVCVRCRAVRALAAGEVSP